LETTRINEVVFTAKLNKSKLDYKQVGVNLGKNVLSRNLRRKAASI
jgi:hypothetical protein